MIKKYKGKSIPRPWGVRGGFSAGKPPSGGRVGGKFPSRGKRRRPMRKPIFTSGFKRKAKKWIGVAVRTGVPAMMAGLIADAGNMSPEEVIRAMSQIKKAMDAGLASKTGSKVATSETSDSQPFTSDAPLPIVMSPLTSRRITGSGNGEFNGVKLGTTIQVGRAPTRSVKTLGMLQGTFKQKVFSTISDYISTDAEDSSNRLSLNMQCGFNQTAYIFPSYHIQNKMSTIRAFFADIINIPDPNSNKDQVTYGLLTGADTIYKISNSNQYYPVKVMAHVVQHLDLDYYPGIDVALAIFNLDPEVQQQGRMPIIYQYDYPELKAATHAIVRASNNASLRMAPRFRKSFEIIASQGAKLNPGDVWELKMSELYGPGIDLYKSELLPAFLPPTCSVIFELRGVDCEAVQQDSVTPDGPIGTYIGTSPGYINMETEVVIHGVQDGEALDPTGGGIGIKAATKTFTKQPLAVKPFNVEYDKVGQPGEVGKSVFIPVISDSEIRYANNVTEVDANPEIATLKVLKQIKNILQP